MAYLIFLLNSNGVSTCSERYRLLNKLISDEASLGVGVQWSPGVTPPVCPGVGPVPSWGYSVSASLPCTNPGLFPLCQYTSKLLSCKVTSEVLFNLFVLVFLHAWPTCMLLWFAISQWVEWEGQESRLSPCVFLPPSKCWRAGSKDAPCCALLCPVVGLQGTRPCSWIWKIFAREGTHDGFFLSFLQALVVNVPQSG